MIDKKTHYACEYLFNIACGLKLDCDTHSRCKYCGAVDYNLPDVTFDPDMVTCKNCKRTKAFKRAR